MSGRETRSSWADQSEVAGSPPAHGYGDAHHLGDEGHEGRSEEPRQRPRLHLKPRSAQGIAEAEAATKHKSSSNPFGAARPREEVLAKKGIDVKLVDERIQKKATPVRLSKDQEEEVEAVRAELAHAEKELREANEQELPEEKFRVLAEQKRTELNELVEKFTKMNMERDEKRAQERRASDREHDEHGGGDDHAHGHGGHGHGHAGGRRFERPSERRRRLEQERAEGGGGRGGGYGHGGHGRGGEDDGAYSSFGGRHDRYDRGHHGHREDDDRY